MVSLDQSGIARASASDRSELGRFFKIVFLATVLPFALLLAGAEWLAWSIGETYTPAALLREIKKHPDLVWMGVRVQGQARQKLAQVAVLRPEVLIMGQSRLVRMRGAMFAPYSCYVLAHVSWPFHTFADLLRHLPADYRPKVIIFNVDFWMFSPAYEESYRDKGPVYDDGIRENLIEVHNAVTQTLQHPELLWKRVDYTGRPARGTEAIRSLDGFLADGSQVAPPPPLFATARTTTGNYIEYLPASAQKNYIFPGAAMGQEGMDGLKEFVELGHKMGITMIGIQMPIYGPGLRLVEADPNYGELADFYRHIAAGYFQKLGLPFYDFSCYPPYTEDHRYFYDVMHPGGPLTFAVLTALLSNPDVHAILPRIDVESMKAQLAAEFSAPQHLEWNPPAETTAQQPAP